MLTAFYIIVAVLTLFVVLSLQVVRRHERKRKAAEETARAMAEAEASDAETPLVKPEEEFFSSPIYKAMEVIAHM